MRLRKRNCNMNLLSAKLMFFNKDTSRNNSVCLDGGIKEKILEKFFLFNIYQRLNPKELTCISKFDICTIIGFWFFFLRYPPPTQAPQNVCILCAASPWIDSSPRHHYYHHHWQTTPSQFLLRPSNQSPSSYRSLLPTHWSVEQVE